MQTQAYCWQKADLYSPMSDQHHQTESLTLLLNQEQIPLRYLMKKYAMFIYLVFYAILKNV